MKVDKQPSPWPCVAMLVGLLLFCLAAPRFWQSDVTVTDGARIGLSQGLVGGADRLESSSAPVRFGVSLPEWPFNFGNANIGLAGGAANSDLLNLFASPSIEELIATRGDCSRYDAFTGQKAGTLEWPTLFAPTSNDADTNHTTADVVEPIQPGPFEASALYYVGGVIADFSLGRILPRITSQIGREAPAWLLAWSNTRRLSDAEIAARSSLRFMRPNDRVAMLPAAPKKSAWCVPQALFAQLERLSGQPYSAQWASHVSNQLHALTERDRLEGDDVQIILADLSDAAEEALGMANDTDEDRLRVELLRAHWALARRLDCWAAMHENHVAMHFQGRVAARGPLSPYFESPAASATPTDIAALSKDLETYESTRDPRLGRRVAEQQRALVASSVSFDNTLADAMEQHYRNANVRVAITAELLNRMIGEPRTESRPIRERIAGASVYGQSNLRAESHVQMDPATDQWQLEVQAKGVVESNTLADGGPIRFRSRGETDFSGRKSIVVDSEGIRLEPSDIDATCHNRLVGVTTDYDWVPLFGSYTRDRGLQEYRARQNRSECEIESRVSSQAGETLDQQTREAVDRARKQLYDRFTDRIDEFGIKLTPVEMKTTPERVVARVRLAGDNQLGSHTPRPRALSDSLASLQIHETALTNLAVTLGLDGQQFTAPELQKKLRDTFSNLALKDPPKARAETIFHFAAENSVQIHINDGRLELTIALDSIVLDNQPMRDVLVHAYYVPAINGLNAELIRDGALGIEGRFSSGDRARLHNVFNTVLPPERHIPIVKIEHPSEQHLDGLMITQMVLEDGWVGMAVGPTSTNRVAERSRSLR